MAESPKIERRSQIDADTLLDMRNRTRRDDHKRYEAIDAELHLRGIEIMPCSGVPHNDGSGGARGIKLRTHAAHLRPVADLSGLPASPRHRSMELLFCGAPNGIQYQRPRGRGRAVAGNPPSPFPMVSAAALGQGARARTQCCGDTCRMTSTHRRTRSSG
jgi:hypothetical protein